MKILFLDVDGVLNTHDSYDADRFHYERTGEFGHGSIDFACIYRLKFVLEQTGAFVVLSSSWRGMEELEDTLASVGALDRCHPHYRTPRHGWAGSEQSYINRGTEIQDWLHHHPEVTRYAIVDDDLDMLPEQLPFYVQTDFENGSLTDAAADRLITILNG